VRLLGDGVSRESACVSPPGASEHSDENPEVRASVPTPSRGTRADHMGDPPSFAPVPVPTTGVDARVALATSLHAAPGVYAVLVGSGMSTAAGVPTGWQIVQDLIRRVAAAEGADLGDHYDEPEVWWSSQGRGEPRLDTLLAALAPTPAARRDLVRRYFEPRLPDGRTLVPTPAHMALATLCASGRVRLILTTNFDPLVERALEQVGLSPEVVATPRAIAGMTVLPHVRLSVLKPNGDYATLGLRMTAEDLATYPPSWRRLLHRVFDEFGLLVIGWSAEWDRALADELAASSSRRYPTFWATYRGLVAEPAARLIAQRQATVIDTTGADEFLTDITDRLGRLDQVAVRRGRPTRLGMHFFMPDSSTPPRGWSFVPPLQLRVAAALIPASREDCRIIRSTERQALVTALRTAPITSRIQNLSLGRSTWVIPSTHVGEQPAPEALVEWRPILEDGQSTDHASYRLGGDASSGISAIIAVSWPMYGLQGGGLVKVMLDVAVSRADPLRLGEVAALFRDALVLTTATVPVVLAAVIPPDAQAARAEVHIQSYPRNEDGVWSRQSLDRSIAERVDLSSLGANPGDLGTSWGFAARVTGSLVDKEAAQLAVDAIEDMALGHGYLNPDLGIVLLKQELGLPTA